MINVKQITQETIYFRCQEQIHHNLDSVLTIYSTHQYNWNDAINVITEACELVEKVNKKSVLNSIKKYK